MEPVRTCLGCRRRADRSALVRVVARDGEVVVDRSGTLPGRGAWVHPARECIDIAIQRKAFGRALRVQSGLATRQVLTMIEAPTGAPEEQAD
ncbi:YlxR family protein [Terrimesophilobacter mesophilus]|uniref:YlxR family protein n=1 Tax=Terrimesophilobacter mesophilus TaxID=433647 RepID=A0A4R8VDF8_9MICO|nr:YlxR family protein [Terrimesophilobacter mesophilus]TFB81411.1 YlxR family protein [Terrimesophilobacter mesophilus]